MENNNYTQRFCKNCIHYNPNENWNECKSGLFGHTYANDHGCWCWKLKDIEK